MDLVLIRMAFALISIACVRSYSLDSVQTDCIVDADRAAPGSVPLQDQQRKEVIERETLAEVVAGVVKVYSQA
jgi:hypothetical protein